MLRVSIRNSRAGGFEGPLGWRLGFYKEKDAWSPRPHSLPSLNLTGGRGRAGLHSPTGTRQVRTQIRCSPGQELPEGTVALRDPLSSSLPLAL